MLFECIHTQCGDSAFCRPAILRKYCGLPVRWQTTVVLHIYTPPVHKQQATIKHTVLSFYSVGFYSDLSFPTVWNAMKFEDWKLNYFPENVIDFHFWWTSCHLNLAEKNDIAYTYLKTVTTQQLGFHKLTLFPTYTHLIGSEPIQ